MTYRRRNPGRDRTQKAKDRQRIAEMRLRGVQVCRISEEVGVSLKTVQRELRRLEEEWRQAAAEDIATITARELRKLDQLEAEAWAEWERSKKDWQKRVVEDRPAGTRGGGGKHAKIETGGQCGDPRYLTVILGIQERRAKLLGTDKPTKIAPTNPDGSALSKEHRDAIVAAALAGANA